MGVLDQQNQSEASRSCCINPEEYILKLQNSQASHHRPIRGPNERHVNDLLLSEAMKNLTFAEREKQEEVLHGVDKDIAEEADWVEHVLAELDSHLQRRKNGSVYAAAERMNLEYVSNRAFRLMFLRGNRYDANAAAEQMLKFFEGKQKLFGAEKLVKDITIEDLNEDDLACLMTGWTQLCGRDNSGRQVIIQLPGIRSKKCIPQSEMRARYFLIMNALKSEKTQLRGCVWLYYTTAEFKDQLNGKGFPEIADISFRCPIYPAAVHFCGDDRAQYLLCTLAIKIFPMKMLARARLHFGSHLECRYRLSAYGIWMEQLPFVPSTYSINLERHLKWIHSCFGNKVGSIKVETRQTAVGVQPRVNDVLYMGGNWTNNGGNHHLRNLVTEWWQTYDAGKKGEKGRVVNAIIKEIHRTGGRFLDQDNRYGAQEVWVVLPIERVRLKIAQNFRNYRRKINGSRKKRNR